MFFRKLIVLMLLGLYGVPAALGPHWHHHHGCSEHACVSTACPTSDQTQPSATVHRCSCEHHVAATTDRGKQLTGKRLTEKKAKPTAWTADDRHGPCAICAFYASAQDLPLVFESASQNQLVTSIEPLEPLAPSTSATTAQARGPPAV